MRWDGKVCPRCGGGLYADYNAVALACTKCNHREAPPRRNGSHTGPQPPPSPSRASKRTPTAPLVALVDVRPGSLQLLEGLCVARGREVVCCSPAPPLIDEAALTGVELLLIEADRGGLAVALARRLRAQAPAVPIAVVLTCWSECEADAQSAAEFVIHAPLREREINGVLERVEANGGSLPSPRLATTSRARVAS